MKRAGKVITGIIGALVILALVLFVCAYFLFREQLAAMRSIEKLDEGLYAMTYVGDYGFEEFLAQGGAASDAEVGAYLTEFLSHGFYKVEPETQAQGCSTIQAQTESGELYFGRNYDWKDCTAMIVTTKPRDGYASVSTCNLDYLDFGEGYLPEGFLNQMLSLAAIYVPLDGMNEKGLCVADLMIDVPEGTAQDTGKSNLTTTTAIRLLLDRAADVDEAVALLEQYDMHSSAGLMHHLALADAEGNSVVVEYIDDVLYVTETPVVTNFFLTEGEKQGIGSMQSKRRFEILEDELAEKRIDSAEHMKDALQKVSQGAMGEEFELSVWSIVYDQKEKTVNYCFRENYEMIYLYSPITDL